MSPRCVPALFAVALLLSSSRATAQNRALPPEPHALQGVQLSLGEDAPLRTLLLRDGRIEAVQSATDTIPADMVVIDGTGLFATPAFIDAWTATGCETPSPVASQDRPASEGANVRIDMRHANRKGIQPAFSAASVFGLSEDEAEGHRQAGFGVLLSAPGGEILAGRSVLAVIRDAAARNLIIRDQVFQHAAFQASGGGYPNTLMGFHAQLRQFFYDTLHHQQLEARRLEGKLGGRPAYDLDLATGALLLSGEERVVCRADSARDIRRWIRLADEFGLNIAIAGGRDAWKAAAELKAREIPVVLNLDWGEEVADPDAKLDDADSSEGPVNSAEIQEGDGAADPEAAGVLDSVPDSELGDDETSEEDVGPDFNYHEPAAVAREKRRLWEERRDNALRLQESGVRILFGTGAGSASDLMKNIRKLIDLGFPSDAALSALTGGTAEWFDLSADFGRLTSGRSATLNLWSAHPAEKEAQVVWSFVDGYPQEFEVETDSSEGPADGVDLSGDWDYTLTFGEDQEGSISLKMDEGGDVTGTAEIMNPRDDTLQTAKVTGHVSGHKVRLTIRVNFGSTESQLKFAGKVKDDSFKAKGTFKAGSYEMDLALKATRTPDHLNGGAN